jgi:hypothetical protein
VGWGGEAGRRGGEAEVKKKDVVMDGPG